MKTKQKNNKILPAMSACCGAVVRNECSNHFSILFVIWRDSELENVRFTTPIQ
jgi:hypothetical protein